MGVPTGSFKFITYLIGIFAVIAFSLGGQIYAQTTTGSIYGTVADSSGAVIQDAIIAAKNTQTGETHRVQSNSSGNYVFPSLDPGDYTVSTTSAGFQREIQNAVRLDSNQNLQVSFTLRAGSTNQSVTVTAATTLVDTRESQLGETVDEKRITDLPLNGRNAYDLVQIVPGVTAYSAGQPTGDQTGTQFSVNGNRANQDSFYLDGAFDTAIYKTGGNLIPNPDALQEFRLLTSNFDAEYGRSPGGVVNIITRSGTNAYHGVFYDYLRNDILNAKNYFDNEVTPLKQNQFGGSLGGAIRRDHAWLFLSYEALRVRTPATVPSASLVTPTTAEAHGDFSALPQAQWPKQNGKPYACNGVQGVICPNLLDPVAHAILAYVPLSSPQTGHPPEQNVTANTNVDQGMVRLDYQLSSSHKLAGMFFTSRGSAIQPGTNSGANQILDFSGNLQNVNQTNAVASDTWIVSPNALNNLRLFYTLNHYVTSNRYSYTWSDWGSQVALGGALFGQPFIAVKGYWQMGNANHGAPEDQAQEAFGVLDTFDRIAGNHSFKFGGSFLWNHYAETGGFLSSGSPQFTGSATGNALADFLLGKANSFRQNTGVYHRLHAPDPALFAQDDWKVSRHLTLNLGFRWEVYAPFVGQNNTGTFKPFTQSNRFPSAPLGLLSAGDPGVPDGTIYTQWKDFSPRVGFAYDIFGNGTTALRGGYGIFYASSQETLAGNLEQQPFLLDITINKTPNLVTPYAPKADPFPYVLNSENPTYISGANIIALPSGAGTPYVQEYNLTLEQQIRADWGVRLGYVGSLSRKFFLPRDQNSPAYVPGSSTSTASLNAKRPYQPTPSTYVFGQITEDDPANNASYNSLQATLTRRFVHGFSLLASYVWSKSIDIDSGDPVSTNLALVNQNDLSRDRGLADFDVPHRFVASYLWEVPQLNRWGFIGKHFLAGWQLNGITTLSTGSPFTVTSGVDTNLDGNNNDRPNRVGNPNHSGSRNRQAKIQEFFNTAAFAQLPANVPYGNLGRNTLIGPGTVNTDLSAFKVIPVWRESTLQFRGEIFNLFNNVNLAKPNAVMTSPSYGQISSSGAPRIVQLALRYAF